ncbi:hypothetical protein Hamer_G008976 [Homarus americanus]|uniref:DUF4817 domain-containing protein n=1 Tax=Homarus americanus TaxID=6706 RepID=A0A8J5JIP9_HOMAM|nr:hypothetical protein Hamer_G008976 [Homarus americanus]
MLSSPRPSSPGIQFLSHKTAGERQRGSRALTSCLPVTSVTSIPTTITVKQPVAEYHMYDRRYMARGSPGSLSLWTESKSVTTVQRQYRQRYGKEPPSNPALGQVSFWKQAAFVTCPEVDAQGCLKSPLNLFRKQSNEVPEICNDTRLVESRSLYWDKLTNIAYATRENTSTTDPTLYLCLVNTVDGDPGEITSDDKGPEGVAGGRVRVEVNQLSSAAVCISLPHNIEAANVDGALDDDEHHTPIHDERLGARPSLFANLTFLISIFVSGRNIYHRLKMTLKLINMMKATHLESIGPEHRLHAAECSVEDADEADEGDGDVDLLTLSMNSPLPQYPLQHGIQKGHTEKHFPTATFSSPTTKANTIVYNSIRTKRGERGLYLELVEDREVEVGSRGRHKYISEPDEPVEEPELVHFRRRPQQRDGRHEAVMTHKRIYSAIKNADDGRHQQHAAEHHVINPGEAIHQLIHVRHGASNKESPSIKTSSFVPLHTKRLRRIRQSDAGLHVRRLTGLVRFRDHTLQTVDKSPPKLGRCTRQPDECAAENRGLPGAANRIV